MANKYAQERNICFFLSFSFFNFSSLFISCHCVTYLPIEILELPCFFVIKGKQNLKAF